MGSDVASTADVSAVEKKHEDGHIGLVVLISNLAGLGTGLVLVLGVFGSGQESVITGAALVSLGFGMLLLVELARRRTDQPQPWALVPAVGAVVAGSVLLVLRPGDHVLGLLGWIWPLLLGGFVVWSVRGARDSLPGSLPSDASRQAREFSASPRELRADRVEFAALRTVFRQDKALTSLGAKPLFVLTADLGQQSGWLEAQRKLATLSTNSVQQTTHGATHIALLEDESFAATSARAITAVVRVVRTSAKLAH